MSTPRPASGTILRNPELERDELVADIMACALTSDDSLDLDSLHTRPTLLRRLAALVAHEIAPATDRIVSADAHAPLAIATALHTGIPYATVDSATAAVRGELFAGERAVLVVTATTTDAAAVRQALADRRIELSASVTAVAIAGVDREERHLLEIPTRERHAT